MSLHDSHRPAQRGPVEVVIVLDEVPGEAIDYDEVFQRGGANQGAENFALCKCPHCGHVYLMEYEVDTLYLDAMDLTHRVPVSDFPQTFDCLICRVPLPETTPLDRSPITGRNAGDVE